MKGFILLDRKFSEWEWYTDNVTKAVFLHILLKANFKEVKCKGFLLKRGQLLTTVNEIAKDLNLSTRSVRTALEHLKKTKELTIKTTNKFSIITVENYSKYQDKKTEIDTQNDKQTTNNRQANDKQPTSIEEQSNNVNNENKKDIYQQIADMYNATCVSLSKCLKLSEARRKALRARLKIYKVEDFKRLFEIAEQSDFLKGANNRNWAANFDWLIADKNMAKTLEGYYQNTKNGGKNNEIASERAPGRTHGRKREYGETI